MDLMRIEIDKMFIHAFVLITKKQFLRNLKDVDDIKVKN